MNLYRLLSLRNDIKAVARGKVPQRIVRKTVYRHSFRVANWIIRKLGVR